MAEFDLYLEAGAMRDAERHVSRLSVEGREGMGLLLGKRFTWHGREYVYADRFVTAANDSSAVRVSFAREAFPELAKLLRKRLKDRVVVGWLHSHPGYGCFLSSTDVATQESFFSEEFHAAVVVDPTREEKGGMLKRAFRAEYGEAYEIAFAVVEKK
ncbi:MAG: Mov34/MPN/PAD-1 family protein [Candidatus Micrarchaeota archaeon]